MSSQEQETGNGLLFTVVGRMIDNSSLQQYKKKGGSGEEGNRLGRGKVNSIAYLFLHKTCGPAMTTFSKK